MLKEVPFANALAVVMGVFYLACVVLIAVAPNLFRLIGQSWIHAFDLSALPSAPLSPGLFLLGLVTSVGLSWITGYLFAWLYNKLGK